MTEPTPAPTPDAKPKPVEFKDAPLPVQIMVVLTMAAMPIALIALILWCSGVFTSDKPSIDPVAEVETAPEAVAATPPAVEQPPEKPTTLTFEVIDSSSVPNIKYSIEYRYTGSGLPTKAELRRVSDEVARRQPGYERYFIGFYLPGQIPGEGFFATAHRNPDVEVNVMSFMVPDRMQEISDFYGN